jgi:hypothetical protein
MAHPEGASWEEADFIKLLHPFIRLEDNIKFKLGGIDWLCGYR